MNQELPQSIRNLLEAIEAHDHLNPSLCKQLLLDCEITPEDLSAWAQFDHPKEDSYGRQLIHNGGFYELMVMSWVDGDMAAIHDHGYTQWGAVKLYGAAEHAIFRIADDHLITAERRVFEPGSVVAVGHDLIHQMGNMGQEPYMTLHLYGSYERENDITADARLYALHEGNIQITSGGVFFNLPEDCIDRRQESPTPDFPTLLRDKVELLKRLMRSNGSLEQGALQSLAEKRLANDLFAEETWQMAHRCLTAKVGSSALVQQRYLDILRQELKANVSLQLQLINAGMVEGALADRRAELQEMVQLEPEPFAQRYLELIGEIFALNFPLALAA